MKKTINTASAPKPIGPYNQAVDANNTLYVSGQIPLDPKTGEFHGDKNIKTQTKLVMENLKNILSEGGYSLDNVVKCSIFINSMDDFSEINEVYGSYFPENSPARETVEVSKLPKGAGIEISCIAVKD